jgi:hypothetical protein
MPRGLSVHSAGATTLAGKRRTHQTPYSQMRKGPGCLETRASRVLVGTKGV